MEFVIVILIIGVMVVAAIFAGLAAKKRREAMAQLAARLGLTFDPSRDHSIDEQFHFLEKLGQGSNRYAYNILAGRFGGHAVTAFDYHYETHSTDSKGRRQTHHHYFSFFILYLPAQFPELTIRREGLFSKIAQFVGYDDIDFESAEFSGKFCVRSRDKKFAYDICHPRLMEYLLANDDLSLEVDANCLALFFPRVLSVEAIEPNFHRLVAVRELFPEYLWSTASG